MGSLRHIVLDGEPWFVAADACRILGLSVYGGPTQRLAADERRTIKRPGGNDDPFFGRAPRLVVVSESGLYKLIMRSDKDAARPFQDWVTKVVLPSIRKTGGLRLRLPI